MADCNDLLRRFLSTITLSPEQVEKLRIGKDAIREKIRTYFSDELKLEQPQFFLQGSYALKTMVHPLGREDYDLDDGIHLQHAEDAASCSTPRAVANWIVKAVEGHVKKTPEIRKKCVRVVYSAGYHIDLPVYRQVDGKSYLGALEANEWIPSDPKTFNDWFHQRIERAEQMRSCIKYLKAWRDFGDCDLKGIHITVLAALNHVPVENRDDESLAQTVGAMGSHLRSRRAIVNPIDATENLLHAWPDSKIECTIEGLAAFCDKATSAIRDTDRASAAQQWQTLMGDRFPSACHNDRDDNIHRMPPVVVIAAKPTPWCARCR